MTEKNLLELLRGYKAGDMTEENILAELPVEGGTVAGDCAPFAIRTLLLK